MSPPAKSLLNDEIGAQILRLANAAVKRIQGKHDEDLVGQVALKVVASFATFDPSKSTISTWVNTVAASVIMDAGRRAKCRISTESIREGDWACDDSINIVHEIDVAWLRHHYELLAEQRLRYRSSQNNPNAQRSPGGGRKRLFTPAQLAVLISYQAHTRISLRALHRVLADVQAREAIQLPREPAWPTFLEAMGHERLVEVVGNKDFRWANIIKLWNLCKCVTAIEDTVAV